MNSLVIAMSLSDGYWSSGDRFTDFLVALCIAIPVGLLIMFGLGRLEKKWEEKRARGEKVAREPEAKIVYPSSPYNRPHLGVKIEEKVERGSRKREAEAAEEKVKTPPPPKKIKNKPRRPAGSGRKA